MKVTNEIGIYEVNGSEIASPFGESKLVVSSHWCSSRKITIKYGSMEITVLADELLKAIRNATNT